MKHIFSKLFLLASVVFITSCHTSHEAYVRSRPVPPPVKVRPMAPSAGYVWVDGEWAWRRGKYHYVNGYYITPAHNSAWIPGHWRKVRRGWAWDKGYWRR
ncbi:hypothetical protein BH11BAC3_BH11BAC3_22660 [soil metagenome]